MKKYLDWIKKNRIKSFLILLFIVFLFYFLFSERQSELPYRVTGVDLLKIKGQCKELAEVTVINYNNTGIGTHELMNHGYSEVGGYCYAEILQNFGEDDSKLLYNTTQEKEVFRRVWPKDIRWYEHDFDNFVLGKSRIIDFRAPW
jgi:hypothetical protein